MVWELACVDKGWDLERGRTGSASLKCCTSARLQRAGSTFAKSVRQGFASTRRDLGAWGPSALANAASGSQQNQPPLNHGFPPGIDPLLSWMPGRPCLALYQIFGAPRQSGGAIFQSRAVFALAQAIHGSTMTHSNLFDAYTPARSTGKGLGLIDLDTA